LEIEKVKKWVDLFTRGIVLKVFVAL